MRYRDEIHPINENEFPYQNKFLYFLHTFADEKIIFNAQETMQNL